MFYTFVIHTHIRKNGPTSFVRDRRAPVCAGHMTRIIESHPPYLKNRRGPRRSSLTGEIGVRRRGFPGQMKQQAGLPKVKRRNRRTPAWQMKLYLGISEDQYARLPNEIEDWCCVS